MQADADRKLAEAAEQLHGQLGELRQELREEAVAQWERAKAALDAADQKLNTYQVGGRRGRRGDEQGDQKVVRDEKGERGRRWGGGEYRVEGMAGSGGRKYREWGDKGVEGTGGRGHRSNRQCR